MGIPEPSSTQTEHTTVTVTTTDCEAPPPYTAVVTSSSSSSNDNMVSSAPPSYDEHIETKKKQVVTVMHVPGSEPFPPGTRPAVRVVHLQSFGADPAMVRCPNCGYGGESKIRREGGTMMWAWVCVLFWFVAWPCSWIPCVMDDCKDVHHECPNCGNHLGQMSRC